MEKKPKPTRELVSEVLNIKARLDSFNLYRENEIISSLNKQREIIMDSYDWSDQEFTENGKSGLMDCFGEIMIPAIYDETWFRANYFVSREKPIACRMGNKWGMVMPDGKGSVKAEFIYDNIFLGEHYSFWSFIVVVIKNKYGFIDVRGNPLTPVDIDEVFRPENSMGLVRKGEMFGFIYCNGDYIEPVYEEIKLPDNEKLYRVRLDGRWGFVSRNKDFIAAEDINSIMTNDLFYGRLT
jgi:hypothetical protein